MKKNENSLGEERFLQGYEHLSVFVKVCMLSSIITIITKLLIQQDKTTRQEDDRSRRQPEGLFFYSLYHNLRHLLQLTSGVGAQLAPSNTGTHFTHHEWLES